MASTEGFQFPTFRLPIQLLYYGNLLLEYILRTEGLPSTSLTSVSIKLNATYSTENH